MRVARKLGLAESDFYQLEAAALLHDIGKIGIPDAILKKEGRLTDEEKSFDEQASGIQLVDFALISRSG